MKKYTKILTFEIDDNCWFVRFPELPGCIAHGDTEIEAIENANKVAKEWLKIAEEAGWDIK